MPSAETLAQRIQRIVDATPVHDIHTHLYDPGFGSLLLRGIDELLVYHYLVSEAFRQLDLPYDTFWAASTSDRAEYIWKALFLDHSPVSESCRGVLTTLQALGLDPRPRDLPALRRWFADQPPGAHVDRVLQAANVASICMTNSPFDDEERAFWEARPERDPRFHAALRIDPLLVAWHDVVPRLQGWGYAVSPELNASTASEVRRFLADWTHRLGSGYCMVSLPPSFAYPGASETAWLIDHAVLPHCREFGQPFAMMMGVKRGVNPQLRLAGDGMGRSDLTALQHLCAAHPENRFLVTCLSRENQHELVVLARKFRTLHPFGCWWFTNTPLMIREITTLRLELLGTSFTPQHSDARVLDQLIYKWRHFRTLLADCLTEKYAALDATGWTVTDADLQRDVSDLLGGSFRRFCSGHLAPSA